MLLLLKVESKEPKEPSTSRAKSRPSPLLSRKKDKSSEKRERVSQEGEAEFRRVQKKIFFDTLFSEERTAAFSTKFSSVSFFLFGGRLLNRNISDDI